MGTLHEVQSTFMIKLSEFFLVQEMLQTKVLEKIQNTHFVFKRFFFRKLWKLWDNEGKNMVETDRSWTTMTQIYGEGKFGQISKL